MELSEAYSICSTIPPLPCLLCLAWHCCVVGVHVCGASETPFLVSGAVWGLMCLLCRACSVWLGATVR